MSDLTSLINCILGQSAMTRARENYEANQHARFSNQAMNGPLSQLRATQTAYERQSEFLYNAGSPLSGIAQAPLRTAQEIHCPIPSISREDVARFEAAVDQLETIRHRLRLVWARGHLRRRAFVRP